MLSKRLHGIGYLVWDFSMRGYLRKHAETCPDFIVVGFRGVAFLFLNRKIMSSKRRGTFRRVEEIMKTMTPCVRAAYVDDSNIDEIIDTLIVHI